ncbi:hypothetical protein V1525DRAFT_387606 [Lipomyces kononenkoae]|uniref:Uncharacterized protein n=1 Tax=Lipomyces kononenkoae TaxID=34357 RepID=A0ACC3T651_LIPKO
MGLTSHLLSRIAKTVFGAMPVIVFTTLSMEMLHIWRVSGIRQLLSATLEAYLDAYLPRSLTIPQVQQRRAQLLADVDARRLTGDLQYEDPSIAVRIYAYVDTTAIGDRDEMLENFFASEPEDQSVLKFVQVLKHARPWNSRL